MSNIKKDIPWILGILVVGLVGFAIFGKDDVKTTLIKVKEVLPLGALTGPILPYDHFGYGANLWFGGGRSPSVGLAQGTSTICSIRSPAATSTIESATIHIFNATATALVLEIATDVGAFGTTTSLFDGPTQTFALGSQSKNTLDFATGSSTANSGLGFFESNPTWEMTPSHYVNFKVAGAVGDTEGPASEIWANYAPSGSCSVIFKTL